MLVMLGSVVLGPIVDKILFTRSPINAELALAFMVWEPVEVHVHGFGAFWLDFAVYTASAMSLSAWRGVAGC